MGYRLGRTRAAIERAPGACLPGHSHEGVPVDSLTGERVGHVCRHCLVVLRGHGQLTSGAPAAWFPYSDDGRPLPMLPDPWRR